MAERDADLLTRDVDGSGLAIQGTPHQTGARLSKNFKKVAAAALGLVSVGILVGIFTAGNHPRGNSESGGNGGTGAMVGQTQPDLDAMERNAHQREQQQAMVGAVTTPARADGGANSSTAVTLGTSADRSTLSAPQPNPDPQQKYRQWLDDQRYKALEAQGLAAQSAISAKLAPEGSERSLPNTGVGPVTAADSTMSQLLQTAQALQGSSGQSTSGQPVSLPGALASLTAGAVGGPRASEGGIPSTAESQITNRSFLDQQSKTSNNGYLATAAQPPASENELFAGSVMPAVLITGIQSDLPGSITASVRQTVYDSRHPDIVLIPQGTRLMGLYTSQVAYGQQRVLVAWNRLIFPNGSTLEIGGMEGTDSIGEAGFADRVNNHYARIFGSAILMSMLGVGAELSQPQNSSALTSSSTSQQGAAAVANELNQVGTTLLNKNLAIQPTITIRPGYAFDVLVNKTIVLPPYAHQP
jgi:type IV secretory pathway VirB10-like protein